MSDVLAVFGTTEMAALAGIVAGLLACAYSAVRLIDNIKIRALRWIAWCVFAVVLYWACAYIAVWIGISVYGMHTAEP